MTLLLTKLVSTHLKNNFILSSLFTNIHPFLIICASTYVIFSCSLFILVVILSLRCSSFISFPRHYHNCFLSCSCVLFLCSFLLFRKHTLVFFMFLIVSPWFFLNVYDCHRSLYNHCCTPFLHFGHTLHLAVLWQQVSALLLPSPELLILLQPRSRLTSNRSLKSWTWARRRSSSVCLEALLRRGSAGTGTDILWRQTAVFRYVCRP